MNATILLVEDNPDILKINRDTLVGAGCRVLEAETVAARLLLETEQPDLLIPDIMLPDGDLLLSAKEFALLEWLAKRPGGWPPTRCTRPCGAWVRWKMCAR